MSQIFGSKVLWVIGYWVQGSFDLSLLDYRFSTALGFRVKGFLVLTSRFLGPRFFGSKVIWVLGFLGSRLFGS